MPLVCELLFATAFLLTGVFLPDPAHGRPPAHAPAGRLIWIVVEGIRADDGLFNLYQWADSGRFPNIKKMMEGGAYGYSLPAYPTNGLSNSITLFTGCFPGSHGI